MFQLDAGGVIGILGEDGKEVEDVESRDQEEVQLETVLEVAF